MSFSFTNLFRFIWLWPASIKWTPRRTLIVLAFFVVFPFLELFVWMGLLLDRVFYGRYRQQEISVPVFVVGNFRSGTTFLHRLLAADETRFTTMKMWEVLFAPSITQRRIVDALATVDGWLGNPLVGLLRWIESFWHEQNVMHEVSLSQPEEDEYVLLHCWSALTIGLSSGLLDEALPYVYFDRDLPPAERRRIMRFYMECVQRQMYAHERIRDPSAVRLASQGRHYLAKNPALTPKLDTLFELWPDAKVIYLVRNPLEAIPSFFSMMKFSWEVMGAQTEGPELRDFIIGMAKHWYRYPLQRLAEAPNDSYAIVNYDDLVRRPDVVVQDIYQRFGFELEKRYAQILKDAAEKAHGYTSRHTYSLESLGMSRPEFINEFQDVFERFGFDADTSSGNGMLSPCEPV